ncbi:helix-turn-helix transcriptional regulator [Tardiphaga sp. 11_C7_N12_6]|uniref:helix-turn-helix transcriptional regulator n=1 Tax=Tardiphaga sp. 11_C7_N12_6 TaxID=3240789 RepID=UPI003F1F120E
MADNTPRLMNRGEAAAYCGISPSTFSNWVGKGTIPRPLQGTKRWDRLAIDQALDEKSGIKTVVLDEEESEADRWFREYEENK